MNQESSTLDQTLNKTDFGQVIKDHKTSIIIALALIIVGALGANIYLETKAKAENKNLDQIFEFRSSTFEPFKKGELDYAAFNTKLESLNQDLITSPLALPLMSDMAQTLAEKGKGEQAATLLEKVQNRMDKTSLSTALLSFQLTALYENQGQFQKAVTTLEDILKAGHKDVEAKIYFDLGRNFLYLENKEQAQKNFNYVTENFKDTEYAKMAKLYLEKL